MTYADQLSAVRCYLESAYDLAKDIPHSYDVLIKMGDIVEDLGFLEAILAAEATT
jgi:hypothetical protein